MMLKQTGLTQASSGMTTLSNNSPIVKQEPITVSEAMEDDQSPLPHDPMLSASLTSPNDFNIDDAMNSY